MQTFVPIATTEYIDIAKTLDKKRLFKQALEAWQILMVLEELDPQGNYRKPKGWANHPAVKMWEGHSMALYKYAGAMIYIATKQGIKTDKMLANLKATLEAIHKKRMLALKIANPELTQEEAHDKAFDKLSEEFNQVPLWQEFPKYYEVVASTHRRALLCKDYEYYKTFNWPEDTGVAPTEYEYVWPIAIKKG